ncbi:MAG: PHP domain-containing protein [Clostridia bacterium]|nr:PHP domain-containing protein [Clostridia bacterium]
MFKYEIHCHTRETSVCATAAAADMVKMYREHGYDGIVVTDHFSPMTFPPTKLFCPQKHTDFYFRGYRAAKKAAENTDFTVLPGCEIRFYATINDYLLFGDVENFLKNNGNLLRAYPKKLSQLCRSQGILMIQAHPFREWMSRCNPAYLDGVEVANGKDSPEERAKALAWAQKNNITLCTGGGDFHHTKKPLMGGILTEQRIDSTQTLVHILQAGEFERIE